jgi:class 3 adenylate cyclase
MRKDSYRNAALRIEIRRQMTEDGRQTMFSRHTCCAGSCNTQYTQRAADIVKKHEGVVVKTIGDEIFAFFEATTDPEIVLKCAIEIIQGFENLNAYKGPSKIEAEASIDFGSTYNGSIVDSVEFDPIGLTVDRCGRSNSLAEGSQIVFSKDFLSVAEAKSSAEEFKSKYSYDSHTADLNGIGKTKYFSIMAK